MLRGGDQHLSEAAGDEPKGGRLTLSSDDPACIIDIWVVACKALSACKLGTAWPAPEPVSGPKSVSAA